MQEEWWSGTFPDRQATYNSNDSPLGHYEWKPDKH